MDDLLNFVPDIEAEGLTLRPVRRSDAGLIEMYGADERVARMTTSIPHPLPPGTTEAFVTRITGNTPDELSGPWMPRPRAVPNSRASSA